MARRPTLVAMAAALAALWPASAHAATAPATAPDLTSTVYAYPAILHWTPGNNGVVAQTQGVYRKTGNCATTADPGGPIAVGLANNVNTYTARPVDGTWCYFIRSTDVLGSADSPGLTVQVDTINPVPTVAVSGQSPPGTVKGTVNVTGTATDAVSGVASSVFHAGAVGACAAGPVVDPAWDTTSLANGSYDVCNVVTDNAGHVAIAKLTLTVANPPPPVPPAPPAVTPVAPPVTIVGTVIGGGADTTAPGAPTQAERRPAPREDPGGEGQGHRALGQSRGARPRPRRRHPQPETRAPRPGRRQQGLPRSAHVRRAHAEGGAHRVGGGVRL